MRSAQVSNMCWSCFCAGFKYSKSSKDGNKAKDARDLQLRSRVQQAFKRVADAPVQYTQTTTIRLQPLTNIDTPELESCVNIPEVEGREQCMKVKVG